MLLTTYLTGFIKENLWLTSTNIILMLSLPLNDIVLPHLYSKFISAIQKSDSILISKYALTIIVVFIVLQIINMVYDLYDANVTPKFQGYMTLTMVRQIMDKYDAQYKEITTGSILARFSKIPDMVNLWFGSFKDYIVPYFITFIGVTFYFFTYDKLLGTVFLFTLLMIVGNIVVAFHMCRESAKLATKDQSMLYDDVEDVINNLLTIFTVQRKDEEIDRLTNSRKQFENHYKNTVLCGMKLKVISFTILTLFFIFLIYRLNYLVSNKKIEIASTIAIFMMFTSILNGLVWIIDLIRDIIRDWSVVMETEGFLEHDSKYKFPIVPKNPPFATGIGMWNIAFSYPQTNRQILKNITFHINRGERVAIIGENGMGKSTILKLLLQLYTPENGGIYVDGQWFQNMSKNDLRNKIGYIPQNTVLFNRTIFENIQYGNEHVSRQDIEKLISDLGLSSEFKNLDKKVGKQGQHLSGGQRQLVWMLRTMIRNPEYIIMDEPTNSLDQQTKDLLISMINKFSNDQTIIVISHDPFLIQHMNRTIQVHNGLVVTST